MNENLQCKKIETQKHVGEIPTTSDEAEVRRVLISMIGPERRVVQ